MSAGKVLLAVTAISVACVVPSGADEGLGVNSRFAGFVVASTENLSAARGESSHLGTQELAGRARTSASRR